MHAKTIIVGTAGHIDHGKTTLVKALTGIDTDRLKDEKERGITIELGFAHLCLPSGQQVGIVDVPGHERFVKNMVAGATGIDFVVLVIAADEGVMPQTREHLEICQLLGVKKGITVLTKKDLVDQEWLDMVVEDTRAFVSGTFLEDAPILAVSSTTGEGLDEFLKVLDKMVIEVVPRPVAGPYRLPVDRVFTIKGFGTVVTGTSISGRVRAGDMVSIYPRGITARVRGIQSHGHDIQEAQPGMRTALNLQAISRDQVDRGDVIATPGSLHPSCLLDLEFLYLASAARPLRHRSPVRFHVGTTEITGRVLLQGMEITPGSKEYIQIRLDRPVAVLSRDRYVIRSYSPIRTIGGGVILNPVPRKRKRSRPELWAELELLARGRPRDIIEYHLRQSGAKGLTVPEIAMRASLYGEELDQELNRLLRSERVIGLEGGKRRFVHKKVYEALKRQAKEVLNSFHRDNPLAQGLAKEELRSRLSPILKDQKLFQRLLSDLIGSGEISQDKDLVYLSDHKVALGIEEEEIKKRLEGIFKQAGLQPPSRRDAISMIEGYEVAAGRIFDLMVREKVLVPLKGGLYYHFSTLERIKDMVSRFIERHGELGIKDFRGLTGGLSRKYMIPLLDYLDSQRVTIRIGDRRILRQ